MPGFTTRQGFPLLSRDSPYEQLSLGQRLWRDPLLLSALLVSGVLASYQLAVTLLQPAWANLVTDWLRAAVAWLAFGTLTLVSRRFTQTDRARAWPWRILSLALLFYALAQSLTSAYQLVFFPRAVPFPWWTDLLALLQYPCFFLTLALWPGFSRRNRRGAINWKVVFDSLLLMGAATALSWYFILAPIYLESQEPLFGKVVNVAYASGDLGVLFGLILTLVPRRQRRDQADQVALVILILAAVMLILGDTWFAWLNLSNNYAPATPPALFWMLASIFAPLAGLVHLSLIQHETLPRREPPLEQQEHPYSPQSALSEVFRVLLPFVAALLTSALLLVRALLFPMKAMHPLLPILVASGLVLLVVVRQGLSVLENAHLRRERAVALANEWGMREAKRQIEIFQSIASHELRTPLTVLTLQAQMVQRPLHHLQRWETLLPPEGRKQLATLQEYLTGIQTQVNRMSRLVNDLLDDARLQEGRLELHPKRTDLMALVSAAVEEQRQMAPERLYLLQQAPTPVYVWADSDRIEQVVTNYLTNALKYSEETTPIEVGVQADEQQARIWVRDHGPGIPIESQAHIWERFHRVAGIEVLSGSGVGLGLGLYISKSFIERHQGQVGVESLPGTGATFWFTLPLMIPAETNH